jgi:hypothetical protein
MAKGALFVGRGQPFPGRERQALKAFGEAMQYYAGLQQRGEIDSFEPVALEPHGGELAGCLLIRGDQEKLARLRASDEFQRLSLRAATVVQNFGVVNALIGEELQRFFGSIEANIADLL